MKNKCKLIIVLSTILCASSVNIITHKVSAAEAVGQLPPTNYSLTLSDTYYDEANNLLFEII